LRQQAHPINLPQSKTFISGLCADSHLEAILIKKNQNLPMLPANKDSFKFLLEKLKPLVSAAVTPESITRAILSNWVAQSRPQLGYLPSGNDRLASTPAITEFSNWLLAESDILVGSFWLSSAFAALLGKDLQKTNAMFFTPPYLSNRILDNAGVALFTSKLIDPACGGAAFLAPAASRISSRMRSQGVPSTKILSHLEANLYGVEVDPFLAELSRTFLAMVLAEEIVKVGRPPEFNIICGDGLTNPANAFGTFDLVLSNPPYRKMSNVEFTPLLEHYGSVIEGQPNLYSVFIKRAKDLAKPGGKIVLLTPMSFLSGRSFSKLRMSLIKDGSVDRLDLIHDKLGVFLGAEQDAVITVWNKRDSETKTKIHTLSLGGAASLAGEVTLPDSGMPWVTPRDATDTELMNVFSSAPHSLSTYGYKPRTGSIVVHRDKRNRFATKKDAAQATKLLPLIWQRDIGTDGQFNFLESETIKDRYVDMGLSPTPAIIDRPAIAMHRVTSPKQSRRLICAPIPETFRAEHGGVTGENHICFIVQENDSPLVPVEVLSEILRTKTLNRLFSCISGVTNVSAYELSRLPLPNPISLREAIDAGRTMDDAVRIGLGLQVNTGDQNG